MGTTLHGIVERTWSDRLGWDRVAEIEFNKNYELTARLRATDGVIEDAWPGDASVEPWERDERFIEEGLMWCTAETFKVAVMTGRIVYDDLPSPDDGQPFRGVPAAVAAFVDVLRSGCDGVRILFYTM